LSINDFQFHLKTGRSKSQDYEICYFISGMSAHLMCQDCVSAFLSRQTIPPVWNLMMVLSEKPVLQMLTQDGPFDQPLPCLLPLMKDRN